MKKTKLELKSETIKLLGHPQLGRAVGGFPYTVLACSPTQGYTVCLCTTDYPNSCPCVDTAKCEPSYRICG